MSRAVLLGSGAFPFLITYWMKTLSLWDEVVDKIYIAVDKYNVPEAKDFLIKKAKENKKIVWLDNEVYAWPGSYKFAYEQSKENVFLVVHDDTFIYDKNVIDNYFSIAEKHIVLTPLHEIYSPKDIVEECLQKKYPGRFPLKLSEAKGDVGGRQGYSFLEYLIFISRFNLERTTIDFGGYVTKDGEDSELLGYTSKASAGDTGFRLALDIYANNIEIMPIPRYGTAILAYEEDAIKTLKEWKNKKIEIFEENAGWLHLQNTGNTIPIWWDSIDEKSFYWTDKLQQIRLAWFLEMLECDDYAEIPEVKKKGWDILNKIVTLCKADMDKVREIKNIFHELIWR